MKERNLMLIILLLVFLMGLTGCGTKYCSVAKCPKEAFAHSDYCPEHKCFNSSCKNKAIQSYSFCLKCIERAQ